MLQYKYITTPKETSGVVAEEFEETFKIKNTSEISEIYLEKKISFA